MAEIYLSVAQVAQRYGVNRSPPWRWLHADPAFPRPISLSARCTRWKLAEIEAWEQARQPSS